ncbi:MAG TPA: P22 phage major capsid protein family protein [Aggregatilineales bacterium]|nr:P22 coat protein - protein 5 domain protein [Anaerolineales bacterium]HRE49702.1 P22 phage major capsid protein family protein [Aggregatilineales bacterium]
MSVYNLIPSVWTARLLANLHTAHVFGQAGVVNRDYEGDIRQKGDSVRINAIGAITIEDYIRDDQLGEPETLEDAQTVLEIDQAKYFHFQIDDVDRLQSSPDAMDEAMKEAAYALADSADRYIAGLYTDAAEGNTIGSTTTPKTDLGTAGRAYEYLVDLDTMLTEANVPRPGRWVVVPPWYYALLRKDERFIRSGTALGDQALRNGQIGMAAGLSVMESNNAPNPAGSVYKIIAGYGGAITFAEQIVQFEAYRPEKRFADAVKGLHLYGAKLVRPMGIAVLSAQRA